MKNNPKKKKKNVIGFYFESEWLRKWRRLSRPIREHYKANPMQSCVSFHTRLKTSQIITAHIIPKTYPANLLCYSFGWLKDCDGIHVISLHPSVF